MTLTEARKVLERYNNWRRYDGPLELSPTQPEPEEIGEAIDVAIDILPKETDRTSVEDRVKEIRYAIKNSMGFDPFQHKDRTRTNVSWRSCVFFTLRNEGYTLHEIGNATGYNHSTVLSACNKLSGYLDINDWVTTTTWNKFNQIIKVK